MDSIFDEDVDEVGGEIEAYCPSPRCKADTTHTIISMYEEEVRRVQCVVCGDVHAFRKPRGDVAEEAAVADAATTPRKKLPSKPGWEDAMARASDADLANCRPYSIRDTYEEGDIVSHPVFDIGIVTELLPDNKVEIIFKEPPPRILVHNRGDLAPRMPGISETPPPREQKKKKRAKKKDEPQLPVERRSAKDLAEALDVARRAASAKMDGGKPTPPAKPGKGAPVAKAKVEPVKAAKGAPKAPPQRSKASAKASEAAAKSAKPAERSKTAAKAAGAVKAATKPAKKAPPPKKAAKPAKKAAPKKAAPKKAPAKKPAAKKPAKKPAKKKK
jgi:hypothetical protein